MNNVPVHYIQQYTSNIQLLLQAKGSKLRPYVSWGSHTGKQAVPVEQIGATNATKRSGRAQPLTPVDLPENRRWVFPTTYDWNTLVDNFDKLKMLIDPTSSYTTSGLYAMGRALDDELIAAFFGTAMTGENGSTSTTFPAAQVVAVNFEAAANVGLTVAKLREAKRLLMAAEVDIESDPLTVAITAKQHDDMLTEAQAISLDYTNKPVLVEGKITSFMGFNFTHNERLTNDATPYRRLPVWAKSGMHGGMWEDITSSVDKRVDLSSHPWQVYVYGTFGATRLEEKKVVEIKCNEA